MLYKYLKEEDLTFSITAPRKSIPDRKPSKEKYSKYIIEYESAIKTGVKENDRVYTEFYLPDKTYFIQEKNEGMLQQFSGLTGDLKVVILIHGFTSKIENLQNYYYFIKEAVQNKYAVLFLHLPFHLNRTPAGEKSGQRLIKNKDIQTLEFFDQSVQDIEKAIAVIEKLFKGSQGSNSSSKAESIKKGGTFLPAVRFFVCGLSLGGMIATIAAAWEPLLEKIILIQCGGNWDEIYWNSAIRIILRGTFIDKEKIKRKTAQEFYSVHPAFLKEYKRIKPSQIDTGLSSYPELSAYHQKTWFLSDPLTFAHRINPEKVLMINSKHDFLFCRKSTELLWEELGMPQIIWLTGLHSSGILRNNTVLKKIFDFIDK